MQMNSTDQRQDDELDATLREARAEFIDAFSAGCVTIGQLIDCLATDSSGASKERLAHILHRMGGLGGTIGLPTVSQHARELEDLVRDAQVDSFDASRARHLLAAMRRGFDRDVSG
jgi:hypothetical protein